MRKTIFYMSVLAVFFSVVSCEHEDKRLRKDIIGSFRYWKSNVATKFGLSIDGIETFNEDGSVVNESVFTIDFVNVSLTYRMKCTGKYKIEDSFILYDYGDVDDDGNIEFLLEGAKGNEEFIEEFSSQVESTIIHEIRERFIEENAAGIYELNNESLVILSPKIGKIFKERIVENN